MPKEPRGRLADLIAGSAVISLASLGFLYSGHLAPYSPDLAAFGFLGSALLAVGWLILFVYGVANFGKRGLWILLCGAPILWVIFILLAIPFACAFQHNCL